MDSFTSLFFWKWSHIPGSLCNTYFIIYTRSIMYLCCVFSGFCYISLRNVSSCFNRQSILFDRNSKPHGVVHLEFNLVLDAAFQRALLCSRDPWFRDQLGSCTKFILRYRSQLYFTLSLLVFPYTSFFWGILSIRTMASWHSLAVLSA